MIRRSRRRGADAVRATPSLLAAEAAQREARERRAEADLSGQRLAYVADRVARHLEQNHFGPRLEAALREGPR